MKILFLIDSLGSGGAQRQLTTIAPLLKKQGLSVEVLCYIDNDFFATPLNENNIPIHWITPSNYLARIIKIRRFIRNGRYDAVVSFLNTPDLLNCIAAIGGHTWKVITSERSATEAIFSTRRGKLIGWLKRYSDAIVCNSENARQLWIKYYPQYKDKLKVIYNIVTLPEITSTYVPRRDGKTHIIVAASYRYLKNPLNVIEAINLLDEDAKDKLILDWYGAKCDTLSGTKTYDEASRLINKYNLNEVIHLNNLTSSIIDRMNEADAVGLFSKLEGLPNAICEGMMLGKPIIMSHVSDYSVLVDESNGYLCDYDNPISISEAFVCAISNTTDQLKLMGELSRNKGYRLFENKNIIDRWLFLCQNR